MFTAILLVILALVIVGAVIVGMAMKESAAYAVAGVAFVLFLIFGAIGCVTFVDARSYGVITSAGKYVETVGSGATFNVPWAKIEEFTTTNKTVDLKKGNEDYWVNFKNGGSAKVDAKITYRIKDKDGIEGLWKEYLNPGKVESALVEPASRSTARNAVSAYDPFDALKGTVQTEIETTIKRELNETLGLKGLEVRQVEIVQLSVDKQTQDRINQQAQAKADYTRKLQEKTNAEVDAQKDAVRKGAASAQDRCLELLRSWNDDTQGPVPPTLNCGLGGGGTVLTGVK